ncbi:MAG TPA: DUF3810 domain-containing protein [Hanamia sp.]|nr:DUF3810 domain-containing protein [Hanamia sp.]
MSVRKYLQQNKNLWIIAFLLIILIKIFSWNKSRVEAIYSSHLYFYFSKILRFLFGWIPFSFGDILYLLGGCWIIWKLIKNIRLLLKKQISKKSAFKKCLKLFLIFAFIYIVFNIFWGINYDRKGIAYQLNLDHLQYDTSDLKMLQKILLEKVNASKAVVMKNQEAYPSKKDLITGAVNAYQKAEQEHPFLDYKIVSVKSSLYGIPGDYLGFTGYYNPFTGEAQINTTVPDFLQPYIATHEMAHQLGYAKENEANFVGYLAAVSSSDTLFHYSAYFDLFLYANREVYYFDSVASIEAVQQLSLPVKKDIIELKKFDLAHRSFIEPAITWMYGNYLKLNNQPKGIRSYNAVVGMLIAYYKKYGKL